MHLTFASHKYNKSLGCKLPQASAVLWSSLTNPHNTAGCHHPDSKALSLNPPLSFSLFPFWIMATLWQVISSEGSSAVRDFPHADLSKHYPTRAFCVLLPSCDESFSWSIFNSPQTHDFPLQKYHFKVWIPFCTHWWGVFVWSRMKPVAWS